MTLSGICLCFQAKCHVNTFSSVKLINEGLKYYKVTIIRTLSNNKPLVLRELLTATAEQSSTCHFHEIFKMNLCRIRKNKNVIPLSIAQLVDGYHSKTRKLDLLMDYNFFVCNFLFSVLFFLLILLCLQNIEVLCANCFEWGNSEG